MTWDARTTRHSNTSAGRAACRAPAAPPPREKGGGIRCQPRGNALASRIQLPENAMSNHVYKMLELTGSSPSGIEDAVQNAIAKANETVRNIQWFSVTETRGHVVEGKIAHWQVTIKLGFTLE
jgi:hypothetical protein